MKYIYFKTLPSTNDYGKTHHSDLPSFSVVYTDHQTSGKGRNQRSWLSPKKENLAFSIILKKQLKNPEKLSIITALSVLQTLLSFKINALIKWPNDLLVKNKKICGILIEGMTSANDSCYIIGIGINVNTSSFQDELQSKATSMYLEKKCLFSLKKVMKKCVHNFQKNLKKSQKNMDYLMTLYKQYSCVLNKEIIFTYDNHRQNGTIINILEIGSIMIKTENDILSINYGEITLQNIYQ